MFTFKTVPQNGQTAAHTVVAIVLHNGTVAGEGICFEELTYGMYRACNDAVSRGYYDAACGHAAQLSEADERLIRSQAASLSKARAEVALRDLAAAKRTYEQLLDVAAVSLASVKTLTTFRAERDALGA